MFMLQRVVISRSQAYDDRWDLESALAARCAVAGWRVLLVPHLYHLREDSFIWARLAAEPGPLIVATWLYPRPARWLLERHRVGGGGLDLLYLKDYPTLDEAYAAIQAIAPAAAGRPPDAAPAEHATVEELAEQVYARWYPVLDRERCRDCGQCHQFCLFGVFALDAEGRVIVENPDLCKPGCPACSRICPDGAILFPLYADDEAIAGAPGRLMAPDAAARKMFYLRTRQPCPVCGSTTQAPGHGSGGVCDECGRGRSLPPEATFVPDIIRDDLDALLDDLDKL